jgi:hypothetical protein
LQVLRVELFQILLRSFLVAGLFFVSISKGFAAQLALVSAEKAIVYSDEQMTSSIGFIRKGKKIKVGDIARNKAQVYPIIISGRMGWIRVEDVTTEKESANSDNLTAERFQKKTIQAERRNALYSLSYLQFASQITLDKKNGQIANNDALTWTGVSLRGESSFTESWDLEVLLNFLVAEKEEEKFKMLEIGMGGGYKIFRLGNLTLKLDAQLMLIPFATYELGDLYRKRSYGTTLGGGLNMGYRFGTHFGIEAYGGFYYTKLFKFDAPEPYEPISPSFIGSRVGVGLTYEI